MAITTIRSFFIIRPSTLFLYDFLHHGRQRKGNVDVAVLVQCHPVGTAADAANDVDNLPVFHDAHGFSVHMADVKSVVGSDVQSTAGFCDEVGPLLEELSRWIKDLNAAVFGIGHDDAVLRV